MTDTERRTAAAKFAADWKDRGDEKQETQRFWLSLLQNVCGEEHPTDVIEFEKRVSVVNNDGTATTKYIDGYIPATQTLIEQKGMKIDLRKGERQSDGAMLTPFQQGRRYGGSLPKPELSYIIGNPPFVGARMMGAEQKKDVNSIFPGWKNAGNWDYVSCWYKKATDLMTGTSIRAALVSTNSVTQGEAVANLWKPLFNAGVHIDFAHRTFRWDSEAKIKAHVHCVIVGFSTAPNDKPKIIYSSDRPTIVQNINGYLIDGENIFIENRSDPIQDFVPPARSGNKPIDNGNNLFKKEEMIAFTKIEPSASKYFKRWYGAEEFINKKERYCLWLRDCPPNELRKMPECMKRVEAVRQFRLASKSAGTVKLADKPTRFHVETMPSENYLILPLTSSERRKYVPIGFMSPDSLASNLVTVVTNATLYHFGILTSNVFMAWMRAVCGRLKSDYRITKDNVYNNFPWPTPTDAQKAKIEQTAQAILDARVLYPDASLADLYDETTMPPELRKAHQQNDKAVMQAYGFSVKDMTESKCVAELMKMYQKLTE